MGSLHSFFAAVDPVRSYCLSRRAVLAREFGKSTQYFPCPRLDAQQGSGASPVAGELLFRP